MAVDAVAGPRRAVSLMHRFSSFCLRVLVDTLAYVYLDTNNDGRYEHSFNEDLLELGLARTTDFSHEHRREFERLREEAEERDTGCGALART